MGAINAMMDAVTLANWINVLTTSSTHEEIDAAFREYQNERHPMAVKAFTDSQIMSKLVAMVTSKTLFNVIYTLQAVRLVQCLFTHPSPLCNNNENNTNNRTLLAK